jgi:hypothetical protein
MASWFLYYKADLGWHARLVDPKNPETFYNFFKLTQVELDYFWSDHGKPNPLDLIWAERQRKSRG